MKNKNLLRLIVLYSLSVIFLIVGSIIAAGCHNALVYVGFAVLFFFLFILILAIAIYYTMTGVTFKKKVSDEVSIDEIQKIEPIDKE